MLEHFKALSEKIVFGEEDHPPLPEDHLNSIADFESKLHNGLSTERLLRIQKNLSSLSEKDLTVQAIRLELAVHKLTNRGFDKIAEDFCADYGIHPVDEDEDEIIPVKETRETREVPREESRDQQSRRQP